MLHAYADQNFLSSCLDHPDWVTSLVKAKQRNYACLVLSPIHFYEFGNAREDLRGKLLDLVDGLRPTWAYSPADQQLLELSRLWHQTWAHEVEDHKPLGDLADVLAAMHRKPVEIFRETTIRQVLGAFQGIAQRELKDSMHLQQIACTQNQQFFRQQRFTKRFLHSIDAEHVAVQLARWLKDEDPSEVLKRAHGLLKGQQTSTYINVFLFWQLHRQLRCYEVEAHMTEDVWSGTAKLGVNAFVDRMHALVALPFCDLFITNDNKLIKRCAYVRTKVRGQIADVLTLENFMARLAFECAN